MKVNAARRTASLASRENGSPFRIGPENRSFILAVSALIHPPLHSVQTDGICSLSPTCTNSMGSACIESRFLALNRVFLGSSSLSQSSQRCSPLFEGTPLQNAHFFVGFAMLPL